MSKKFSVKNFVEEKILNTKAITASEGRKDFIRLDLNEGFELLDDSFLNELKSFDDFTVGSYPEYAVLKKEVAKYAGVKEENISLSDGSDQAITLLINLFFRKGSRVVIPSPTFFVFHYFLKLVDAEPIDVLYKKENGQFKFPLEETLNALTEETQGLILCNPNNPLGVSIPEQELIQLFEKTKNLGMPVIIDEAYFEYYGKTAVKFLKDYDNLIIIRTFSKAFGLAGVRLGYIIASKEIINEFEKLKLPWCVNHFSVFAGIIALKNSGKLSQNIKKLIQTKKYLFDFIKNLGIVCHDTDTNFIICEPKSAQDFISKMRSQKILVSNVSNYLHSGNLLSEAVRISIPRQKDLEKVKKAIKKAIKS